MIAIYAVDVGSTLQARFAWARTSLDRDAIITSTDIEKLIRFLTDDLRTGARVALGFEAPLFIPIPPDVMRLSRAREGEGDRSWAAQAASTVALLAVHQSAWLLRSLREELTGVELTFDWNAWQSPTTTAKLLCWEAFVSGAAHGGNHSIDAATTTYAFRENLRGSNLSSAVTTEHPLSLIAAAALWSGWTTDLKTLHQPVLVIKPSTAYLGPHEAV